MESLGQHLLLDFYDCINCDANWDTLKSIFYKGLNDGNFTVLTDHYHEFEPHGVSGVFVLAESHLAFHIWVELSFVSLDIYWCGKKCDEQKLLDVLFEFFQPQKIESDFISRGIFENQGLLN